MGLSNTVSTINGDFSPKLQFVHPRAFNTPAEWVPLGIGKHRVASRN